MQFVPISDNTPCDDGDSCGVTDTCQAGKCAAGVNVCACAADTDCAVDDPSTLCDDYKCVAQGNAKVCTNTPVTCLNSGTDCKLNLCDAKTGKCSLATANKCDDALMHRRHLWRRRCSYAVPNGGVDGEPCTAKPASASAMTRLSACLRCAWADVDRRGYPDGLQRRGGPQLSAGGEPATPDQGQHVLDSTAQCRCRVQRLRPGWEVHQPEVGWQVLLRAASGSAYQLRRLAAGQGLLRVLAPVRAVRYGGEGRAARGGCDLYGVDAAACTTKMPTYVWGNTPKPSCAQMIIDEYTSDSVKGCQLNGPNPGGRERGSQPIWRDRHGR